MVLLARVLSRLVGALLLIALAAVGIAVAVFCIQGDHHALSLPQLATYLHLSTVRDSVGRFLHRLETPGPTAWVAALGGLGAMLLGAALLIGALVPTRERLVVLADDDGGRISARRRALAQVATTLAEQPAAVLHARTRVRPRRFGQGGRVLVRAEHLEPAGEQDVGQAVQGSLDPLVESLPLSARVRTRRRAHSRGVK